MRHNIPLSEPMRDKSTVKAQGDEEKEKVGGEECEVPEVFTPTQCDLERKKDDLDSSEEDEEIEDEEMEDEDEEEGEMDPEEAELDRAIAETERQIEEEETAIARMEDGTGRMRAYQRQWELTDLLRVMQEEKADEEGEEEMEESGDIATDAVVTMTVQDGKAVEEKGEERMGEDAEMEEMPAAPLSSVNTTVPTVLSKSQRKRMRQKAAKNTKKNTPMEVDEDENDENQENRPLHAPPYDLQPYAPNEQATAVKVPLSKSAQGATAKQRSRKERIAAMRREKEQKREPVMNVYNPYAAAHGGNMWPADVMERIQKAREERQRRKDAGLTESEEEESD